MLTLEIYILQILYKITNYQTIDQTFNFTLMLNWFTHGIPTHRNRKPDIRNPDYHCGHSGETARNPDLRNTDYQHLKLHYPVSMLDCYETCYMIHATS